MDPLEFDYIIIGAGTAGCVLANRLSENPDIRVLVAEAGAAPDDSIDDPHQWIGLMGSDFDWHYETCAQPGLFNRSVAQPRGKVLGGTSSINGMLYTRPLRFDFDQWAYFGATGWNYESMAPYLCRVENFDDDQHPRLGHDGMLHLQSLRIPFHEHPFLESMAEACRQLGYPVYDNFSTSDFTKGGTGLGWFSANIYEGKRFGAFRAYLQPALERENVTLWTGARATRLLFEQQRCTGAVFARSRGNQEAIVRKEVLLCAGSIESPKLLLLSGIGPAGEIAAMDIPVQANVPGVGKNFHDHVTISTSFQLAEGVQDFSQGLCRMALFAKSDPGALVADLEYLIMSSSGDDGRTYLALHTSIQRPLSRGWIRLNSPDPMEPPEIHPNLLGDSADLTRLVRGVVLARELLAQPALKKYITQEYEPGPEIAVSRDLENWVRQNGQSQWHICGSCKMGIDDMSVVDPELKVRGVSGIRVVDTSIWPSVVTGHAQATVFAMAERAADLIREEMNRG